MLAKQVATLAAFAPTPVTQAVYARELQSLHAHTDHIDAAVLFADISGFTGLAESLAMRSDSGSEELTALLNLYFTHMITLLESYGGQVVKFSGDAMTAIFTFQDAYTTELRHRLDSPPEQSLMAATLRATFAAIAMQRAMIDFQGLPTSIGTASLALKIGVGAGATLAAHVGGVFNRWEYVIAGDSMAQAVYAQEHARRGMVVLSAQAAALIGYAGGQEETMVVWDRENGVDDDHPLSFYPQPHRVLPAPLDWSSLSPDQLAASQKLLRAYIPAAIGVRLEAGQYDWFAELRRMTVMFIGVGGITYRHHRALNHLQTFVTMVQETIYRFEGSLNKIMVDDKGTVLLILFGAPPLAHEDDPLRALAFAHELQSLVEQTAQSDTATTLRIAIGITNDTVFAGPVGSATRGEYTVMGDAVNLAARLMQLAGDGGTLCDQNTYAAAHKHWSLEPLELITIKGKSQAVQAYRSSGLRVRTASDVATPLVGREHELSSLMHWLGNINQKRGHVVSLIGEGGIGKTRLIHEAISRLRSQSGLVAVLQGEADSLGQQVPYLIWRDVLVDYFGLEYIHDQDQRAYLVCEKVRAIDPDLEPRLALLNDVLDLELPETPATRGMNARQRRDSLSFLIVQLVLARAQERALLLVLDDIHWADRLSWELALDVARAVELRPVFLLLGYRPGEETTSPLVVHDVQCYNEAHAALLRLKQHHSLHLLPLDHASIEQLTSAALDNRPVAPAFVTWLTERSLGNPLFVEETVKVLREQNALYQDEQGVWQLANDQRVQTIPPTLKGVIQTRLDRLEPAIQLTCKVASVIGRVFLQRVVADIYPMREEVAELEQHMAVLHRMNLILRESHHPEPSYQFKSALMQEAAYTSLLLAQRQTLHQAVAEWYEREYAADLDTYVPLLADHYSHTDQWHRFLECAERAGNLAAERYASASAVAYLSRAINVLRTMPKLLPPDDYNQRMFGMLLTRAEVHAHMGNYALQAHDLQELQQYGTALADEEAQARVHIRWTHHYQQTGDYQAAEQSARAALTIAQRLGHRQLMGESNNGLARNAELRADYRQALWSGFKALGDSRLAEDRFGEACSMDFLGVAYAELGDYTRADTYYQQALTLRRAIDDRWGEGDSLSRIGNLADKLGRPRAALDAHRAALTIRRSIGDRRGEVASLRGIGSAYQALGDLSTAQTYLHDALTISHTLDDPHGEAMLMLTLSSIATKLGNFEPAQRYATEGLQLARTLGNRHVEARGLDLLGNASRELGMTAAAYQQHATSHQLYCELGLRRGEAYALHHLGEWEWTAHNYAAAFEHWEKAAAIRLEIGEEEFARATRTRQAHALLHMGHLAEARALADGVWEVWGINPPPGEDEDELREAYLSLYETWQQLGEDQRANAAIAWAYQAVQDLSVRISDPVMRQSFLNNVVINRNIVAAWNMLLDKE